MKIMRFALAAVLWIGLLEATRAGLTNRYVVKDNAGSVPYDSWANAAADIQTAINYAYAGETVLVASATYDTGGGTNWPSGTILTNRVAIYKAITVRSASNDPVNTIIKGRFHSGEPNAAGTVTNGPAAVRCVHMTNGSSLIGFTLTNGATTATAGDYDPRGGGIWCQSASAIISNCVIAGNCAMFGGGVNNGTLYNCTLSGNKAITSGANGGGAIYSCLYNCLVTSNSAIFGGGGFGCSMYNCLVTGNSAAGGGGVCGGGISGILRNCTIVGNTTKEGGGGIHVYNQTLTIYNCIVYFNHAIDIPAYSNYYDTVTLSITNCCTTPASTNSWAPGNITSDPMFITNGSGYGLSHVVGNYRLSANSPCINTGLNQNWMTNSYDLDGRTRIRYGIVDMGAYERINEGTIYKLW